MYYRRKDHRKEKPRMKHLIRILGLGLIVVLTVASKGETSEIESAHPCIQWPPCIICEANDGCIVHICPGEKGVRGTILC